MRARPSKKPNKETIRAHQDEVGGDRTVLCTSSCHEAHSVCHRHCTKRNLCLISYMRILFVVDCAGEVLVSEGLSPSTLYIDEPRGRRRRTGGLVGLLEMMREMHEVLLHRSCVHPLDHHLCSASASS